MFLKNLFLINNFTERKYSFVNYFELPQKIIQNEIRLSNKIKL